jgi:formylglycine-generating enzyme
MARRLALIFLPLSVAACAAQYHPEYHPESRVSYVQNIVPAEVVCPDGSKWDGAHCVRRQIVELVVQECPLGTEKNGLACTPTIETACPRGMHFKEGHGCLPDLPVPLRGAPPIPIPASMFWMGLPTGEGFSADWLTDRERFAPGHDDMTGVPPGQADGARPRHLVRVDAFEIDRTEVTQRAYQRCVLARACTPPEPWPKGNCQNWFPRYPDTAVNCVTYEQAATYCSWAGKRLPTEEEWEYAASGTDGRAFPWGEDGHEPSFEEMLRGHGHRCAPLAPDETCRAGAVPAGASPFGVLDMLGDLLEWTASPYCPYSSTGTVACNDPRRVLRGSWNHAYGNGDPAPHQMARRFARLPQENGVDIGFRCARG